MTDEQPRGYFHHHRGRPEYETPCRNLQRVPGWCVYHQNTLTRVRTQNGKRYYCRRCAQGKPPR